jgi:hypothetical protein
MRKKFNTKNCEKPQAFLQKLEILSEDGEHTGHFGDPIFIN